METDSVLFSILFNSIVRRTELLTQNALIYIKSRMQVTLNHHYYRNILQKGVNEQEGEEEEESIKITTSMTIWFHFLCSSAFSSSLLSLLHILPISPENRHVIRNRIKSSASYLYLLLLIIITERWNLREQQNPLSNHTQNQSMYTNSISTWLSQEECRGGREEGALVNEWQTYKSLHFLSSKHQKPHDSEVRFGELLRFVIAY